MALNATSQNVTFNTTTVYNIINATEELITTTEAILTRPPIIDSPDDTYIESCVVSDGNKDIILAVILVYGLFLTCHLILKGLRTFHLYNMKNEQYIKMLFCDRIGLFFGDFLNKRNIYIIIFLHIWNQATDIGVIVEMYYLSFSDCTIEFTLLYRLFAAGLAFMLFYRFTTAILTIYATQQPIHFFYQLFDLLLIKNLELNYIFEKNSIDEVQLWIIYCSSCLQSFPIMIFSMGIMTLTQGFSEHPYLLLSFIIAFILCIYSIISTDRIIYIQAAWNFDFNKEEIFNYEISTKVKHIFTGYCCYCAGFRIEYIYRIIFRAVDFQFRIFILNFLWTAIGGVYLALYLLIEFLILYNKSRKIGRYQLLSGLLGIVINYSSEEAKKFCQRFALYRIITNYLLLIIIAFCVNYEFNIPISDPYERRRADFVNMFNLYVYLCVLSVLIPWLYFCAIRGGDLIRSDDDAATNPCDPHCIISNRDFPTFLHLVVFKNKFHHGNEWVLQSLLNAIGANIFRIPSKYLHLLLSSYKWDFRKISYYTKSKFFASIMRFNDIKLSKLLFDKFDACNDIRGIESGLLYWSQCKNFSADNLTFLRMIKLIETKFQIKKLDILTQASLLKYTILYAAQFGDLIPFHAIIQYNLNNKILLHLYLHYSDFFNYENWNSHIFADILHKLHHVKNFYPFNMDNNTNKCFLFWALKFKLWETINELLINEFASKQVYSKYINNMPFLHFVCSIPCDYKTQIGEIISKHLCKITDICIDKLYTSLNEQIIKTGETILMYACKNLHIPLIKTILKYGPRLDIKDGNNNNYKWYIENNYFMHRDNNNNNNNNIMTPIIEEEKFIEEKKNEQDEEEQIVISFEEIEIRKKEIYEILELSENMTLKQEEFVELYEERYDEFVVNNDTIPLYRSSKNDTNSLFESIIKYDFQKIINLIDKKNLDPNLTTIDGTTPLHFACQHSGALIVKFLLDRGSFTFKIKNDQTFAIDMIELNNNIDKQEKEFMKRLLNVRDVDHDPFAMTDERVIEIERIQLFFQLFIKYMLILFIIFIATFATSAGLTDRFKIGYDNPL